MVSSLVSEDNAFQAPNPLEEWRGSAIQLSGTPAISRLTNYFLYNSLETDNYYFPV